MPLFCLLYTRRAGPEIRAHFCNNLQVGHFIFGLNRSNVCAKFHPKLGPAGGSVLKTNAVPLLIEGIVVGVVRRGKTTGLM
jgi:hypothetical protein